MRKINSYAKFWAGLAIFAFLASCDIYSTHFPLSSKKIVIDISQVQEPSSVILDDDLIRNLAEKLASTLKQHGAQVALRENAGIATGGSLASVPIPENPTAADVVILITRGVEPRSAAHGIGIFYRADSPASEKLAKCISQTTSVGFPLPVNSDPEIGSTTNAVDIPIATVRLGDVAPENGIAMLLLPKYQQRLISSISNGIFLYFASP